LIWRFTLVLIKINYGQIGDQTGLFYTTNPVFYTSGNRFVCHTDTFGNLWFFSLVPSDNRNSRSTCLTSVFTGIGQTLTRNRHVKIIGYQFGANFKLLFCAKYDRGLDLGFWEILKPLKWTNITSFFLIWLKRSTKIFISLWI
jgi:hypothetical protein